MNIIRCSWDTVTVLYRTPLKKLNRYVQISQCSVQLQFQQTTARKCAFGESTKAGKPDVDLLTTSNTDFTLQYYINRTNQFVFKFFPLAGAYACTTPT